MIVAASDGAGLDESRNTRCEFPRFPRTVVVDKVAIVFIAIAMKPIEGGRLELVWHEGAFYLLIFFPLYQHKFVKIIICSNSQVAIKI